MSGHVHAVKTLIRVRGMARNQAIEFLEALTEEERHQLDNPRVKPEEVVAIIDAAATRQGQHERAAFLKARRDQLDKLLAEKRISDDEHKSLVAQAKLRYGDVEEVDLVEQPASEAEPPKPDRKPKPKFEPPPERND